MSAWAARRPPGPPALEPHRVVVRARGGRGHSLLYTKKRQLAGRDFQTSPLAAPRRAAAAGPGAAKLLIIQPRVMR